MAIRDLIFRIIIDSKKARAEAGRLKKSLDQAQVSGKRTGSSLMEMFSGVKAKVLGVVAAFGLIAKAIWDVTRTASRFQEANSKFNVVFAGMTDQARQMRQVLVQSFAMGTVEATKYLSSMQDLLVPMGMAREEAANLSFEIVKLAADLGSFNDLPTEQVMMDIQSALVGNFETMKKYGVVLNETRLKQEAMNMGLWNGKGMLDASTRAQVAYKLIVQSSQAAVGDMARTQDSFANIQKRLNAATENLSLKFGAVFLPIMSKVLARVVDFIDYLGAQNIAGALNAGFKILEEFVTRIWSVFSNIGLAIKNVFTGNFEAAKENAKKAYNSIASGWSEAIDEVIESYRNGQKSFEAFMKGTEQKAIATAQMVKAVEQEVTQKTREEAEKRRQAIEAYWDAVEERIRRQRELANEEFQNALERENERIEYLFQSGRMSYEDYASVLQDRIETARVMYGEESLEYMRLVDRKKQLDQEYHNARIQLEQQAASTTLKTLSGLMRSAQGINEGFFAIGKAAAYAQALVDTYAGANRALAAYPPPFSFIQAAAVIAKGMINVARISAVKFERRASGGYLGSEVRTVSKGNYGGGENRLIIANAGEYIVNADATARNRELLDLLNFTNTRFEVMTMQSGGVVAPGGQKVLSGESGIEEMIEAIRDIQIVVNANLDAIQFYKETYPKYEKIERGNQII